MSLRTLVRQACEVKSEEERWRLIAWSIAWEGCIGLRNPKKRGISPYVEISNTSKEVLEKIVLLTNVGKIYVGKRYSLKHKVPWVWKVLKQAEVKELLIKIKDFLPLRRKKCVADLVIEFCELRTKTRACWSYHSQRELEIVKEIGELNRKGYRIINDNKEVEANVNP